MFFCVIAAGTLAFTVSAADPILGKLPNGEYYLKHEVDFALKEDKARDLSPAGPERRKVDEAKLLSIHPGIKDVVGGHTAARKWLDGEELPDRVKSKDLRDPKVPKIARSLKAILREDQDAAQVVADMQKHPDIEWASLNKLNRPSLVPSDARWADQWGPTRVRADDAWDVSPATTTIRVAVIDSGVDLTHPDLASRIVYNQGFGGNANGDCKRDRRGGSSIDHGTHVAGIAAAIRNTIGIAGIARANIMAMGCASWSEADNQYLICCSADAINDAVANGADVINCSYGNAAIDASETAAYDNAQSAGVLIIAAAGNDGENVDTSPSQGWNDHSWPLLVSNTQEDDTLRPSSNFGSAIDLAAPGTDILSTVSTNFFGAAANGNYDFFNGTSMSAPTVAGGAAMIMSMNSSRITGSGVKHFLYRMAQDLGITGKDSLYGNGMLQLQPDFLQILKDGDTFVNSVWPTLPGNNGSYHLPYNTVAAAVTAVPTGGTIVLNGGTIDQNTYHYPAPITITKACTLNAFPDRPAVIGE
jgi:subtilisin family serine protease